MRWRDNVNEDDSNHRKEEVLTKQSCQQSFLIVSKLIEMMWSDFQCYAKHDQRQAYIEHDKISRREIDVYWFVFQGSNRFITGKLKDYFQCIQSKNRTIHSTSFRWFSYHWSTSKPEPIAEETASWSHLSFSGCPAWPRIHTNFGWYFWWSGI